MITAEMVENPVLEELEDISSPARRRRPRKRKTANALNPKKTRSPRREKRSIRRN